MAVTTFEYADGEYDLTVTVGTATVAQGIERTRLALQASEARRAALTGGEEQEPSLPYINEWTIRLFTIPAIIAATREVKNEKSATLKLRQPITAEKVMDIPEALLDQWYEAVLQVNPHWKRLSAETDDSGEAKEPSAE